MKKIAIIAGAVAVVGLGAVLALPALVPAERIKDEVVGAVKGATGRDLSIQGKVSVSVLPSLSVQVSNVALSNPPGFTAKEFARLGALDVKLKLFPLLSGKVEVDSFVLVDPVIALEVDRQGRANWVFGEAQPAAKTKDAAPSGQGGGMAPAGLSLGEVRISNGKLTYADARSAAREEVERIDLAVTLKSLDDPFSAKGQAAWRGKTVTVALSAARPRALVEGGASAVEANMGSEVVTLAFKGEASGGAQAGAKGDLDLSVPSVRNLAGWATGKPLDMPGSGLGPFSLKGKLAASGASVALSQAQLSLDAIKAAGDIAVNTAGSRPAIKGRLEVETLDLNPYLPPEDPAKAKAASATAGPGDWSDAPLDASGLKAVDADLALAAGGIKVRAITIGKSALHVALKDGRLAADLSQLSLYDGTGKGKLALDGSSPGIGLDASFTLAGLKAEPFLRDAAQFDRIEGTGGAEIHVTGRGRTERQLVSSLDGRGEISFLDGAIKGINLAEMVRNVGSAFTAGGGSQKTDFAELGGSFTINDGIVTNKDLALKSPLLRVEGAGTVDMPKRRLDYRVEPKAVASLQGQGAQGNLAGVMVPVLVEGPWHALSFRPDLAGAAKAGLGKALEGALSGQTGQTGGAPLPIGGGSPSALPLDPGKLFGR